MNVTAAAAPAAHLAPFGEHKYLPTRYTATVDEPGLPLCRLEVSVERGKPVCDQLLLERRPGGPPVGAGTLRDIPLGRILRESVAAVGYVRIAREPERFARTEDGSTDEAKQLIADSLRDSYNPRQGVALTDELLRGVADIYREALAEGSQPTRTVMERLQTSRSTAGRYVQRARARGFLGPTRERVAGEQES